MLMSGWNTLQFPPSVKKGKISWDAEYNIPDGIIARHARECSGNMCDRHVVEIISALREGGSWGDMPDNLLVQSLVIIWWRARRLCSSAQHLLIDLPYDAGFGVSHRINTLKSLDVEIPVTDFNWRETRAARCLPGKLPEFCRNSSFRKNTGISKIQPFEIHKLLQNNSFFRHNWDISKTPGFMKTFEHRVFKMSWASRDRYLTE
jgi:hypothetical protein